MSRLQMERAPAGTDEPLPQSWWQQLRGPVALATVAVAATLAVVTPARIVVVPLVLALFPAALLAPAQRWLRAQGVAAAAGAALLTAATVSALVVAAALAVPMLVAEAPQMVDSIAASLRELVDLVDAIPLGVEIAGLDALVERGSGLLADASDPFEQATAAVSIAGGVVAGTVLWVIGLFFYLKDGTRLAAGARDILPARWREHAGALGVRSWETLGAFFRGQLLVAGVDAVFIGAGLLLIGVPLALPLAVLVLLGGLLPIVGAVASGAVAVLVAVADGGLGIGLAVLALVVAVQQLESNLLQPVVMSRRTMLHPLVVIVVIALGWVLLGVLGAFLAVPTAACAARALDYWRAEGAAVA